MAEAELEPSTLQHHFVLPPDWKDEDRMHFLLGPLPSSTLCSSDPRITFWSSLIVESCRATRRLAFTGHEIPSRLQWRGQTASCMQEVLTYMRSNGQLCMMRDLRQTSEQSWLRWGADVLSRPVKWMWGRYLSLNASNDVYVCTQLLKEAAASVLSLLLSRVEFKNTDLVMTEEQLKSVIQEVVFDASSVEAVELELVKGHNICCKTIDGIKVVRVAMPGVQLEVNHSDLHIIRLKNATARLEKHTTSLAENIARLKNEARSLVLNQRNKALSCLKESHKLQQRLDNEMAMLENLEDIMYQIQRAETHYMVLEAYQQGAKVLKSLNEVLLPAAEEAVNELDEVRETSEEIELVLGGGENKKLEQELEELLCNENGITDDELCDQIAQLELISPPETTPTLPSNKITHSTKLTNQQKI